MLFLNILSRIANSFKSLLYYTVKFDFYLIYSFSKTPVYLLWLVFIILGFFGGKSSTGVNFCFLIIVTYITGTATLIFFVCTSKSTLKMIEYLVGSSFVERFAPRHGLENLVLLVLPIFIFLLIEICTVQYQVSNLLKVYEGYSLVIKDLALIGDFKTAEYLHAKQLKTIGNLSELEGVISKLSRDITIKFPLYIK